VISGLLDCKRRAEFEQSAQFSATRTPQCQNSGEVGALGRPRYSRCVTSPSIRQLESADYDRIEPVVDEWWGGRPVRGLLQRLFFEHFGPMSFFVGSDAAVEAFLIGFRSQSHPGLGYIHFVGVRPDLRGRGLGRLLYERFFEAARSSGCAEVQCITSPHNAQSVAFHRRMGFELLPGAAEVNGFPVSLNHAGPGQARVVFRKQLSNEFATGP
jgi:GNAT superfamily N-acetyltransferase